jgi:ElaB/YqjD/DUF883 family membrane-anchored ribosome-binding protein
MTEQNQATDDVRVEAEDIAASGENVRERVRRAVVRIVRDQHLGLDQLAKTAGDVMDGAIAGVKELAPDDRERALRQVVDGIADAVSRTATATRLALQETAGRGQAFTRNEVEKTLSDLRVLQDQFVEVLTRTTSNAGREMQEQIHSVNEHIRRTAADVRPHIESAIRAAMEHPVQFAGDAAKAGVKAVPKAAGMLLQAIGGALQGAGDVLAGVGRKTEPDEKAPE